MKTNYRKSLEKQFKKYNEEHSVLIANKEAEARENKKQAEGIYKLSEQSKHEFLSYAEIPWTKEQKDLRKLEKLNNKLVKAFEEDTTNGEKIVVKVPQRLQFLLNEGNNS